MSLILTLLCRTTAVPPHLDETTHLGAPQLVKDGLVIRLPQVVHSRARVNLRHEAKK